MNWDLASLTLELLGEVLIAYAALSVHYRVRHEHDIDDRVFLAMRREHALGILGVILLITGYLLQLFVVG